MTTTWWNERRSEELYSVIRDALAQTDPINGTECMDEIAAVDAMLALSLDLLVVTMPALEARRHIRGRVLEVDGLTYASRLRRPWPARARPWPREDTAGEAP